jgi:hypothetical protein
MNTQAQAPGDFKAIPGIDNWEAQMLADAYEAVMKAGCWNQIASFAEESFMFSSAPWLHEVQKHMTLMDQHSGSSYGFVMRVMEFIAKDGWDAYVAARITRFEEKQAAAAAEAT